MLRSALIGLALGCVCLVLGWNAWAETKVRPYPDHGYAQLGVYAGGPPSHFDYQLQRLILADSFPNKKQWWESRRADHKAGRSNKQDIYMIHVGLREGAKAKRRIDAWLKPEPGVPTSPELIPAICLEEENILARKDILDALARHIRSAYRIPVFQWWSDPMEPSPQLTADGWIFDAYFWGYPGFRKHLMKFVALGKPVVCVVWAADPAWRDYAAGKYSNASALMHDTDVQFRTCMEFNVSTALFAVAGPHGSVGSWLGSDTRDMVALRNWVRTKRAHMHAVKPGELPLTSANFSHRSRAIPVGGDADAPSVYEEDFSGFRWIEDANVTGFLDLKLTSLPQKPGFLLAKTRADRPVEATLTYRFESYFPLQKVAVQLEGAAAAAARGRNEIAVSLDEQDWPLKAEQAGNDRIQPITLRVGAEFLKGSRTFFLRVRMSNDGKVAHVPANRLDRLTVKCVHKPPPETVAASLVWDIYGDLSYDDDFSTPRWKHFGHLEVAHKDHGGHRGASFWVGMVGGFPTSTHLLQRLTAPRELKELSIAINVSANTKDLGGHVDLQVAPRGQKVRWKTSTDDYLKNSGGIYGDWLPLPIPAGELRSGREFDIHIKLRSTSGVEGGPNACAAVSGLKVRAK